MSEWKFVGHCFDGDHFEIEGVNVWSRGWQSTGTQATIGDPLYTWQSHTFSVYTITDGHKVIEFAAGEFSNTVWGFFQRVPPKTPRQARPRHPMPEDIKITLETRGLMLAYLSRPAYQQNDYLGWISYAKRPETRQKRINQMLDELHKGDVYMKMAWQPKK